MDGSKNDRDLNDQLHHFLFVVVSAIEEKLFLRILGASLLG